MGTLSKEPNHTHLRHYHANRQRTTMFTRPTSLLRHIAEAGPSRHLASASAPVPVSSTRACSSCASSHPSKISHNRSNLTPSSSIHLSTPRAITQSAHLQQQIRSLSLASGSSSHSHTGLKLQAHSEQLRKVDVLGQIRGMKVRSSVRRFCDGCSVVRRLVLLHTFVRT